MSLWDFLNAPDHSATSRNLHKCTYITAHLQASRQAGRHRPINHPHHHTNQLLPALACRTPTAAARCTLLLALHWAARFRAGWRIIDAATALAQPQLAPLLPRNPHIHLRGTKDERQHDALLRVGGIEGRSEWLGAVNWRAQSSG